MMSSCFCIIKLIFFASAKISVKRARQRRTLVSTSLLNFPSKVAFSLELVVVEMISFR